MKVVNKTRNAVLSENASLAASFFSRMRGLMFSKNRDLVIKASKEGVLESSIHMTFMLQPIDVVWVDSSMKVVGVEKRIRPHNLRTPDTWKVYKPEKPALYVIELGRGSAGKTKIGDEIEFMG